MKKRSTASEIVLGDNIRMSVPILLRTNIAIVGNSGSGKSLAGRQLIESLQDKTAEVIFDTAGEFFTLRERFDYLLVGPSGEIPADPAIAADLARFVREKGCRVIIDLSGMEEIKDQQDFVFRFIKALLALPRSLWKIPLLVYFDEVQLFAPQEDRPLSRQALINLATLGRKQRICGAFSTQRLADTAKALMSSVNNRLYGRFADARDLKAASEQLGFAGRKEWTTMQEFEPGDFYVGGPACEHKGVRRGHTTGKTKSTHIDPSQDLELSPAPPSRKTRSLAMELANKQAALDAADKAAKNEVETLRKRVQELEGGVEIKRLREKVAQLEKDAKRPASASARAAPAPAPKIDPAPYVLQGREDVCRMFAGDLAALEKKIHAARDALDAATKAVMVVERAGVDVQRVLRSVRPKPEQLKKAQAKAKASAPHAPRANGRDTTAIATPVRATRAAHHDAGSSITGGPKRILIALAQHPDGLDIPSLRLFAQIGTKSSMRTYIGILLARKHVIREGKMVKITAAGLQALGSFDPLPEGRALIDYWLAWVGTGGPRRILEVAIEAGDEGVDKEDLLEVAAIGTASSLRTYVGTLQAARLIETVRVDGRSRVKAVASLLEAAA